MIIIPTSAEIDLKKDQRTQEYSKTISWLKENIIHPIHWLECVSNHSFIEEYYPVYYSNTHQPHFFNKGANLGLALKSFFDNIEIKEDLVVQMTGRYYFTSTHFFDVIEKYPQYDLYVKNTGGQYFTGCFAMKTNIFKKWLNQTDWIELNNQMKNIEMSLYEFSIEENLDVFEFDKLYMDCNIFGSGIIDKITI